MRIVLRNHNEVAHIWAQQNQQHGRASNMFFYGSSIFSYGEHYTIAKFQENGSVLINSESPSVSTSKHSSIVRGSIPDSIKTFEVPSTGSQRYDRCDRANLKHYAGKFAFYIKKASKARKYFDLYLTRAKGTRSQAFDYSKSFDCEHLLKDFDFDFDFEADDIKEKIKAIRIREAKRKAEKLARVKAEMAEKVAQWREGKKVWISSYPETLLRLVDDGKTVETSKGAYFPTEQARKAIRFVKALVESGTAWERNGGSFKLGNYQLDAVSTVGTVRAGCHVVKFAEIEKMEGELVND